MIRHLRTPAAGTLAYMRHGVVLQRLDSSSQYVTIKSGDAVLPGELIRISASSLATFCQIRIIDAADNTLLDTEVGVSLGGEGWLDVPAPEAEGSYRVVVTDSSVPFLRRPRHDAETQLVVSASAGRVPDKPQSGWGGLVSNLKTFLIVGAVIAVAVTAIKVLPSHK